MERQGWRNYFEKGVAVFTWRKSLSSLFVDFRGCNVRIRSPRTVENYQRSIRALAVVVGHSPTVRDLTDDNLGRLMRYLVDVGKSAPTVNNYCKPLRALWTFASGRGLVKTLPRAPKLPEPELDLCTWTEAEAARLLRVFAGQPGYLERVAVADILIGVHYLAWDTAERKEALLGTLWEYIDWDAGLVVYPADSRKGRMRSARYKLRPATVAHLDQLRQPVRERVFPAIASCKWHRNYNAMLTAAGLPAGQRHQLQKWRRTVATLFDGAGGDATALLGHSSPAITERHYLDPSANLGQQPADLLQPIRW
jgi:integrase